MVEVYDALEFIEAVRYLCKFDLQQILLSCEYLQIVGISMLHQKLGVPHCGLQIHNLLLVYFNSFYGCLPE